MQSVPHLNPTRQTSKVSCKKEEIKQSNANGTPKTLKSFEKQQKSIKGKKPKDKQEGDQVEHL
jgi:hypothetical protein